MAAIFARPVNVTAVSGSQQATAPLSNALIDPVGSVWRSMSLSNVTAYFTTPTAIDTVALYKNNLEATAQIRVRIGASQSVVDGNSAPVDRTFAAWSGLAPYDMATSLLLLEAPASGPYIRVDINSTNSDGFVEVQRLVFSKRITADGVADAEPGLNDGSVIDEGPGYTTVDQHRTRDTWKFTVEMKDTAYWTYWRPLLRSVGQAVPFLFVPDTSSSMLQGQVIFGRNSAIPKPQIKSSDFYAVELAMLAV